MKYREFEQEREALGQPNEDADFVDFVLTNVI